MQVSSNGWFFIEQVPASWASGWLLNNIGTKRSLFVGNISVMCEQLCAAMARTGWHCTKPLLHNFLSASRPEAAALRAVYAIRPLRLTSSVAELAMSYTQTAVGAA